MTIKFKKISEEVGIHLEIYRNGRENLRKLREWQLKVKKIIEVDPKT